MIVKFFSGNPHTYRALAVLNGVLTILICLWAGLGLFSMHVGWGLAASLLLFLWAFAMIRNAVLAHANYDIGNIRKANAMLAISTSLSLMAFGAFLFAASHEL